MEKELKDILFDLKKDAINMFKSDSDVKRFLDNIASFNNYSFNNMLLIYAQNENAKYITSFKTIQKMGYKLNKGAKGIKIFVPFLTTMVKIMLDDDKFVIKPYFLLSNEDKIRLSDPKDLSVVKAKSKLSGFGLGNVFDIKDTNMPLDEIEQQINPVLEDKTAEDLKDCFIKTIYCDGYKVKFENLKGGTKGYTDLNNKVIVIDKELGSLMTMKVLIHEYAHALAHKHLKDNNLEYQVNRNKYETEAEAISYVVSKFLKLTPENSSFSYLYSWSKNKDFQEIDDSLNTIVNYSKKIINNFKKFYLEEFGLYAEEYKALQM